MAWLFRPCLVDEQGGDGVRGRVQPLLRPQRLGGRGPRSHCASPRTSFDRESLRMAVCGRS